MFTLFLRHAALPLVFVFFFACQKEKEKIVYVEVPVEVEKVVDVEKLSEVKVPGETVVKTIEKLVLPESVDNAVVSINPGNLALSTGVSLIPPKGDGVTQGPGDTRSFSLFRSETPKTDYDLLEEDIVIWNQAQEPLKNVNNFLCVIGKTAYNKEAAADAARRAQINPDAAVEVDTVYIAKVTIADCSSRDTMTSEMQGGNTIKAPTDITIKLYKEKKKPLQVSLWYNIKIKDLLNTGGNAAQNSMQGQGADGAEDARNYYLFLRIAEPVSQENPFGLFDLEWDSYDTKNGTEKADKSVNGHVVVYRKPVTNDLMLNFFENATQPNPWNSDWVTYIKNQAIAQLDVKAMMNDDKEITGYEIRGGDAHTAINYSWAYVGNDPNNMGSSSGQDNSGSYSLAFDSDYITTKYNMAATHYNYNMDRTHYDPEAASCTTRNENWANVWEYALFAPDGSRISQPNGYMIKTGKIHPEWKNEITGWFSRWGMWVDGVANGETIHLVDWISGTETPYIYTILNGRLMDQAWMDITAKQSTNLTFTCTNNCPKAPITQADVTNNDLYLPNGNSYTYTFDASTKKLHHNGQEVRFADGVSATGTNFEWSWNMIDTEMAVAGTNYRYQMSLNPHNKAAALRVKNSNGSAGAFYVMPDPIEFEPFTYNDALHAYEHNGNVNADGRIFNLTYDGYLTGINYEQKAGRKDQWNYDMWAPEIVLRRGTELIAANNTGRIKAGDKIKLAPRVSQHTAKNKSFLSSGDIGVTRDGCSMALQERLSWIKHDLDLPVAKSDQNTKLKIGERPQGADNKEPPVLYMDGEALK